MQSPRDPRATLVAQELLPGLTGYICPTTGGCWIDGEGYWNWLRARPELPRAVSAIEGPPVALDTEDDTALISPRSGRLMRKFRVGRTLDFHIDFDPASGGFWLDGKEYETLRARNLHDELHLICSEHYQKQLLAHETAEARERHARASLGEELCNAINSLVERLEASVRRDAAIAYLRERLERTPRP